MAYVPWLAKEREDVADNKVLFFARELFRSVQDLDCRITGIKRPYSVTDVLIRCLTQPTNEPYLEDKLWAWTLPQRLQGLLAIVITGGDSTIQALEQCLSCGETMELDLDLTAFVHTDLDKFFSIEPEAGTRLLVAIPTGLHQLEWLRAEDSLSDEDHSLTMATNLTQTINGDPPEPDWRLPRQWLTQLQKSLEEHDPLTALSFSVECPNCSEIKNVEVDLEGLLLMQLKHAQKAVLEEIYHLARIYNWTEEEILNMPAWRRRFYIGRSQQEMEL